ncbi:SDR family oxidoreductase [bacterium]|nr:SDR family oxidoreductase [bacterium]
MTFSDQAVLVTGASRGIGKAVAQEFAKRQAKVAVHYNQNKDAAMQTLRSLTGQEHCAMQANVEEPESVRMLVERVIEKFGKIDTLINNAGVFTPHPITDTDYDTWQGEWGTTLQTNLVGAANITFCVVQHMLKNGGGRIVNITSRGAFRGEPESPAYGASKAGLNSMSQSLAKALAPHNIFVYAVAPGYVETDMVRRSLTGPEGEAIRHQSPLGRVAKPEEIARTVLFLASKGTDYLTGCIVDANGASYLRT